jgi:hypothetical protein
MRELRRKKRRQRAVLGPLRPVVSRAMTLASPYLGKRAISPGLTLWDDICAVYDVPEDIARTRSSMPPPPPFEAQPS